MEVGNSEINPREVLPNVHLVEPVYFNGKYALNLNKDQNPKFYDLAERVINSVESLKPSITDIVGALNKHVPPVDQDMGTYRKNTSEAKEIATVPIDSFFNPQNSSAYCLERSLLSQLVFAHFGLESKLTNIQGQQKSDTTPHLNHVVLEVEKPIKRSWLDKFSKKSATEHYFIESTSVGRSPVRSYEKSYYIREQSHTHDVTLITHGTNPNAFSPLKSNL